MCAFSGEMAYNLCQIKRDFPVQKAMNNWNMHFFKLVKEARVFLTSEQLMFKNMFCFNHFYPLKFPL